MSKQHKLFTDEQMATFRQNPYVLSITPHRLAFTKEFKELFYKEYQQGHIPRQILQNHGFDTEALGNRRIWGIAQHIKEEFAKNGEFHEGYSRQSGSVEAGSPKEEPPSEKAQLKELQNKVDYLEQEIEFLKKISSIRNTRK